MSTLKEVLKPKSSKNSSSKTPQFYQEEKNRCIAELASHSDANVRKAIASNSHTPTKVLKAMLSVERDKQVFRALLLNDKTPRKALAKIATDKNEDRLAWFDGDEELIERFQ